MDRQGRVLHFLLTRRSLVLALVAGTLMMSGCASGGRGGFPNFFASKDKSVTSDEDAGLGSASRTAEAGNPGTRAMTAESSATPNQAGAGPESGVNRYTGAAVPGARPSPPASVVSYSKASPSSNPTSNGPALVVLEDSREFMSLLNTEGPVLLDFFTTWCGPCKKQSKILHEMEGVAAGNGARIIKIDAEKHREIAKQFQVKVYPTLVLLKDGAVKAHNPGAIFDKQELAGWLSP